MTKLLLYTLIVHSLNKKMGSLNVRQLLVLVHLLLVVSTSVMSYPVDTSGEENGLHLPPDTEAEKKLRLVLHRYC